MNKLLILPIATILILGCSSKKEAKAIEYDYSDVADLTICWNDIEDSVSNLPHRTNHT